MPNQKVEKVVTIDSRPGGTPPVPPKIVATNQKALDALPLDSGTWSVEGVPGLYVRCRAKTRSFFVQRRIEGHLVKKNLGELTMKYARAEALRHWSRMKPKPAGGGVKTFEQAFREYLDQKELSPKTRFLYEYNLERYLDKWKPRSLEDVGNDRAGVRALYQRITAKYGRATANQVVQIISAVYRWARKVDLLLPEPPTVVVDMRRVKPRDWALDADQLREWWDAVKLLKVVKRMWWLTCLFTGARRGSIEALKWTDVDLAEKTIRFRVAKGDRPYRVPASDKLIELFDAYRDSGEVPPSEWVFPSPTKPDWHIVNVRDDKRGVKSAHRLRHTFRTTLADLGATSDQARLLMGHSMGGDVSRDYITAPLLVDSLRPVVNAVVRRYLTILGQPLSSRGSP